MNKFYFIMKKVFIITLILVAGLSCEGFAQFRLSVGPVFGMGYNFYHGSTIDNTNMSFNGLGLSIGGQLDMSFTPVIGMLATVSAYDMMSAKGSLTQQQVKNVQAIGLGYLAINPAMKFSIPKTGLGFFVGPGIGFNLVGTTESYQIANGQRTQTAAKSDLMNTNIRVNGQIGILYDFDLKSLYLSPFFLFDYGFTDVVESWEWKASGIKFGLSLKFKAVK
jgi:hypothetical protein